MWGGDSNAKQMLKSRGGTGGGLPTSGDDESDYFPPTPRKDSWWSTGLLKLVTATVIFMGGVVLGLSVSGSVARYYYNASHAELFFPTTTYSCDPRDRDCGMGLAFRAFVHPPRLAHSMTDDELFWRASLVPKAEEFPFQRVPKVAFLFMARGPLPFAPLWDKFFRDHQGLYSVYVHTVPDYKLNVSKNSAFYGRQIPSQVLPLLLLIHCSPSFFAATFVQYNQSIISLFKKNNKLVVIIHPFPCFVVTMA
jgi:hypothetical protein